MAGFGTLFLVATPIGNLEDISLRALRTLREVDLIACEDTRRTAKLLSHYGITVPRESHHEHNETSKTPRLIGLLKEGKNIALVSDAGTPLISDPGHVLISACRGEGIPVTPIPGASAAIAALAGSGIGTGAFLFAGFLPVRQAQRRKKLGELGSIAASLIVYEAPHRIMRTLADAIDVLGPRQACLARELTKIHEEWLCGTLEEIAGILKGRERIQGEITLVIAEGLPKTPAAAFPDSIKEHVEVEMGATGASQKETLKSVARQRGISRREAYQLLLEEKNK